MPTAEDTTRIQPPEAAPLLAAFATAVTPPTAARFQTLLAATRLTTGRRTVAGVLRTLRHLAPGHPTAERRVRARAQRSSHPLGGLLARLIMARLPENEPIRRVGDDTVDGHTGRSVSGTARHRDPVRSTHRDAAGRYGHTGVVLAIRVTFPFATRAWALPILVDRDRSEDDDRKRHRLHRTPAQILCRLLRLVMIRIPGRRVRFAGDSGFGTHAVARFCRRHPTRLTRVSKRHPDANRSDPPPPDSGKGRPRVTGSRRAKPAQAAGPAVRRDTRTVSGYGGGQRNVAVVGDAAQGFKGSRVQGFKGSRPATGGFRSGG